MLPTAYSLLVVGSTALVGGLFYLKRKEVDLRTGIIFAIPSFVGVYSVRSFVVPQLPNELAQVGSVSTLFVMLVFAIIMLFAALSMIREEKTKESAKPLILGARVGFQSRLQRIAKVLFTSLEIAVSPASPKWHYVKFDFVILGFQCKFSRRLS